SRARGAPSSNSTAVAPPALASTGAHTVAAPRAGYSSVVWVLVDFLIDQSGQLNTLGTSTRPSGPSVTGSWGRLPAPVIRSLPAAQRRREWRSLNSDRAPPAASSSAW